MIEEDSIEPALLYRSSQQTRSVSLEQLARRLYVVAIEWQNSWQENNKSTEKEGGTGEGGGRGGTVSRQHVAFPSYRDARPSAFEYDPSRTCPVALRETPFFFPFFPNSFLNIFQFIYTYATVRFKKAGVPFSKKPAKFNTLRRCIEHCIQERIHHALQAERPARS